MKWTSRWVCLAIIAGLVGGCASTGGSQHKGAVMSLQSSSGSIYAGERVTFMVQMEHTLHNPKVDWSSTGGSIQPMHEGRVAQVTFTDPGTYTVTATLMEEGKIVEAQSADVTVKALPDDDSTP